MKFLKEADTGRYFNVDHVEVIVEGLEGVVAFWRNPEGKLEEVAVNDWDFDADLADATTVPAAPGTWVLQDLYGDVPTKVAVVAWRVAGQRAYPVTVLERTMVDLHRKDRAILHSDGHVELGGDGWSVEPQTFSTLEAFHEALPMIRDSALAERAKVRDRAEARVKARAEEASLQ